MASHYEQNMQTFKSSAAMTGYLAVKPGADGKHVAVGTASTDSYIGISQSNTQNADERVEVALPGGGAKATIGATVAFGEYLTADSGSNGKLVPTTTAGDHVIAQAMDSGVANDVIPVMVINFVHP